MFNYYPENDDNSSDSSFEDALSEVSTIDSDNESDDSENVFEDEEHEYQDELIFMEDADHFRQRVNHKYYLGICQYIPYRNIHLLVNSVSPRVYFRNEQSDILRYLTNYSIIRVRQPVIEIMKLYITQDESYSVILKTFWIRIIQRCWKKVFRQRIHIIQTRRTWMFQKIKEMSGRYPSGYNQLPELKGMLSRR